MLGELSVDPDDLVNEAGGHGPDLKVGKILSK